MTDLKDLAATPDSAPVEAQKYQHYTSSRVSMRMMTPKGKRISFTNYTFITADEEVIAYLDGEINSGIGVITKGELLTHEEADPMETLKRKHIEEYKAEQEALAVAAAKGVTRNMGDTKSKEAIASGAKPMSSAGVTTAEGSGT